MKMSIRSCFCSLMIIVITFLSLGCVLCGCGNPDDDSQTFKSSLNFRITWKAYSGRGEALGKIVDSYNQINKTDYKINIVGGDEDLATIETLLSEGDEVDIYMLPYRYVQYLGAQNQLEELTANFAEDSELFYKNLWDLGVVGQKVYGIPWLGHSMALIYNKQLLDEAGINPDTIQTPQDLLEACKKIEENTDAAGIGLVGADHNDVSWMVNQFIYGFGGSLVNADGTEVTVNSEAAKEAIEYYRNGLGAYAQSTWTSDTGVEVMDYFREQKVAFEIQGPWGITDIVKNGSEFETGVISLVDLGLSAEIGPMMVSLKTQLSDYQKTAAVEFIKYLISVEAQEMIMDGEYSPELDAYFVFRLPVRKDIVNSKVFTENPQFIPFLSGYANPSIDVPVPSWQTIKDEYYTPKLHLVMKGKMSIDTFLEEIQVEGNKILQEGM